MRRLATLRAPTGDPRRDALAELRWAMAGEGLTADKVAVLRAVVDLPAVRDAVAGVPATHRPVAAFHAIVAAARGLGESVDARLLRAALGIGYDGDARNLTERRASFGWVGDPRTLYDREQKMAEALVTLLGAPPAPPRGAPPTALATVDVTYRFTGYALHVVEHSVTGAARYVVDHAGGDGQYPACVVHLAAPVGSLTVRVAFDLAVPPRRVWRVGDRTAPGEVDLDDTGRVAVRFTRPDAARPHGVAWEWLASPIGAGAPVGRALAGAG
jgi:hypothetical protein